MIVLQPKIERLIEKHAKRAGITKEQAIEIVNIYFQNVKEAISKGTLNSEFVEVYIPKIGTFKPNYKQITKVNEIIETRKQQSL